MNEHSQTIQDHFVSCLCISKNKPEIIKKAIECFVSQSFENKELIIVKQDADQETFDFIKAQNHPQIKLIDATCYPEYSLGELRNLSVEEANGDLMLTWDDDDWYHIDRIKVMVESLLKGLHPTAVLTNILIYDDANEKLYFSAVGLWEGSLIYEKNIVNENLRFPPVKTGEDTVFLDLIKRNHKVLPVINPILYIYNYHNTNTSSVSNFSRLLRSSQPLSDQASQIVKKIMTGEKSCEEASLMMERGPVLEELNYFYLDKMAMNGEGDLQSVHNFRAMEPPPKPT